jgi:EamA domain-containing membrane protein RarD
VALTVIVLCSSVLFVLGQRGAGPRKAALFGIVAGMLFGTSACLVMPTIEMLHVSVGDVLSHRELYAMAITGITAFVLQQVSLSTGYLATSVATVSVANPVVSVILGVLLFDELVSRPPWHIVVAAGALVVAMIGAVMVSIARERRGEPGEAGTARTAPA